MDESTPKGAPIPKYSKSTKPAVESNSPRFAGFAAAAPSKRSPAVSDGAGVGVDAGSEKVIEEYKIGSCHLD
jgi:hypothetical protein